MEYGVTFSHSSEASGGLGLVAGPFESAWDAHNHGADVMVAQRGTHYALVRRPVGGEWESFDGRESLAEVRARRGWA